MCRCRPWFGVPVSSLASDRLQASSIRGIIPQTLTRARRAPVPNPRPRPGRQGSRWAPSPRRGHRAAAPDRRALDPSGPVRSATTSRADDKGHPRRLPRAAPPPPPRDDRQAEPVGRPGAFIAATQRVDSRHRAPARPRPGLLRRGGPTEDGPMLIACVTLSTVAMFLTVPAQAEARRQTQLTRPRSRGPSSDFTDSSAPPPGRPVTPAP